MSAIRKIFNRERITGAFSHLDSLRIRVSHATVLEFSILALILILGFTIRLLPMRWGYYISEFDPYWQYRMTKDIVQNGYTHWTGWTDIMGWWPWGKDVARTAFPGLPMTMATFYNFFHALGVPMLQSSAVDPLASDPVYNFVVLFPVIMATLTILIIYFFGRDIGGKEVGLFAAFFLALNASYIGRTSLGFSDDETVGIFGILLFSLFFLRAVDQERPLKTGLLYGIGSGLTLGYIFASWGASRYPEGLAILFVAVLILLRRYSPRLLTAYGLTFGIGLFIALNVPKLGPSFLQEETNLAALGVFLVLVAIEIGRRIKTVRMKSLFAIAFVAALIVGFFALSYLGYARSLQGKFLAVVNPFLRFNSPVVSSVQEQRPAAWGSIYYDVGIGILFIPLGFYFAAQNPTNRNIYLILFGLTGIYFASTMVRLLLILAPALCLLWALALTRVLKPFITLLREKPISLGRKMRLGTMHVGREFSAGFLILILGLLAVTYVFPSAESRAQGSPFPRVIEQAYVPSTIASASLPVKPDQTIPDWLDALTWMRYNLPSDTVVAAWWDYGYWITNIANRTTLVDNGTLNTTQIARVGQMFLSNPTEALKILKTFNQQGLSKGYSNKVGYIVVFSTFTSSGSDVGYGDESKWRWMANIAGNSLDAWKQFGNYTLGYDWVDTNNDGKPEQDTDQFPANAMGQNTTLYTFLQWGKSTRVTSMLFQKPADFPFDLIYWSQRYASSVVTVGSGTNAINALVTVFRVNYPPT